MISYEQNKKCIQDFDKITFCKIRKYLQGKFSVLLEEFLYFNCISFSMKIHIPISIYNAGQKLLRKPRKTASYFKPQAIENSFKRAYGEVEDNIVIYI